MKKEKKIRIRIRLLCAFANKRKNYTYRISCDFHKIVWHTNNLPSYDLSDAGIPFKLVHMYGGNTAYTNESNRKRIILFGKADSRNRFCRWKTQCEKKACDPICVDVTKVIEV